jgi:hypothetical protein
MPVATGDVGPSVFPIRWFLPLFADRYNAKLPFKLHDRAEAGRMEMQRHWPSRVTASLSSTREMNYGGVGP